MRWQRLVNPVVLWLLRSPAHWMLSASVVALTFLGRKSGIRYAVPVNYVLDDETILVMSPREHTWWRNLLTEAPVLAHLRGRTLHCTGHACTDAEQVGQGLLVFLHRSTRYQKAWSVPLNPDGNPRSTEDLIRAARGLALIRVVPVSPGRMPVSHEEARHAERAGI